MESGFAIGSEKKKNFGLSLTQSSVTDTTGGVCERNDEVAGMGSADVSTGRMCVYGSAIGRQSCTQRQRPGTRGKSDLDDAGSPSLYGYLMIFIANST